MAIDALLDIIVPLNLDFVSKNETVRRRFKLPLLFLILGTIISTAVVATLDLCPEGVTVPLVLIMVIWRIFVHAILYCALVLAILAKQGKLQELINGNEKGAARGQKKADELLEEKESSIFDCDVDEEALAEYIRSNPEKFASGEDMAVLYLIMSENRYVDSNMTKFHEFISMQIECRCYRQMVYGCFRVKEIFGYDKSDERRKRLLVKCEEMQNILKDFIYQYQSDEDITAWN